MKQATVNLLCYAKAFYRKAEQEYRQGTTLSRMQAILSYHDAVEFCVRAVMEEPTLRHESREGIGVLIQAVDEYYEKQTSPKKLPWTPGMELLNTTRGKIKHYASIPSYEDTQRCRIYARDFLEQVCQDYFSQSFADISLSILIEHPEIRLLLQDAEQQTTQSEYLKALINVKKAFLLAQSSAQMFVDVMSIFDPLTSSSEKIYRELFDSSRSSIKVRELENTLALVIMGIDVLRLKRFYEITPYYRYAFTSDGQPQQRHWYRNERVQLTKEIAQEAFEFALEMILKWQEMGVLRIDQGSFSFGSERGSGSEDWKPILVEDLTQEESPDKDKK